MMFLDDFSPEAPIVDAQDNADQTDVYAFFDSDTSGADVAAKESFDLSVVLSAEEEAGQSGGSTATIDLGTEDVFVFLASGVGNGSAVPDSATPAPEEEEPETPKYGSKYELENIGGARHTVLGAIMGRLLVGR